MLVLFGASGTGKTHLVRGLVRQWQSCHGEDAAEYLTASDFRREFHEAAKQKTESLVRGRMRSRQLLAVDDLHQLPGEAFLLEELRHTLDHYHDAGDVLLLASQRPVTALGHLTPDLRSRLSSGLLVQLAAPGLAARARIVRHVSAALRRPISEEAVQRLAAGLCGTAVELIGALYEFFAASSNGAAGIVAADRLLANRAARRPTLPQIIMLVAKHFRLPQRQIKSGSRKHSVVSARATIAYLAREFSDASYEEIGRALGGRDHTTIMHSYQKIEHARKHDLAVQESLDELRRTLLSH